MSVGEKLRPSVLELSKDKNTSDMIMRIVSPITPQFVRLDMRDTFKVSEEIRLQQNELIASGKYGSRGGRAQGGHGDQESHEGHEGHEGHNDHGDHVDHVDHEGHDDENGHESSHFRPLLAKRTPLSANWADEPGAPSEDKHSQNDSFKLGGDDGNQRKLYPGIFRQHDNYTTSPSDVTAVVVDCEEASNSPSFDRLEVLGAEKSLSDSATQSPTDESQLGRIHAGFLRKTLKRNNTPGPLRFSPKVAGAHATPMINSAPMRSFYGLPNMYRRPPVRYVYPGMAHFPQTAFHYVPAPMPQMRRGMVLGPERVMKSRLPPRLHSARRRKPVLDVFEGLVAKLAPMPSQPPSAQRDKFDVSHSDDEKATQAEMEEMERKRKNANLLALKGSISFNGESAFNFTLYQGNEANAKKKFMEICETTWDKYMASSAGSSSSAGL